MDVLTASLMLDEVERVDGLRARATALEQAQLLALAFHEPAKLAAVAQELDRERRQVVPPSPEEAEQAAAHVTDLQAYAARIARRKRRQR